VKQWGWDHSQSRPPLFEKKNKKKKFHGDCLKQFVQEEKEWGRNIWKNGGLKRQMAALVPSKRPICSIGRNNKRTKGKIYNGSWREKHAEKKIRKKGESEILKSLL